MITTTFGAKIGIAEFVDLLRSEGLMATLVARVSRRLLVTRLAEERGVAVTQEELQTTADAYRISTGMHSATATHLWLKDNQMTEDSFQDMIKSRVLERKLEDDVDDALVKERFDREKARFERVRVAQIIVDSAGLADELVFRIREESADFAEVAREYSLDDLTRDNGGYLGLADRNSFDGNVCEAIFAAEPDDVVGPFSLGDSHYFFKVIEVLPARLDRHTQRVLRRLIVDEQIQDVDKTVSAPELEEVRAMS